MQIDPVRVHGSVSVCGIWGKFCNFKEFKDLKINLFIYFLFHKKINLFMS